ncbi:hypothetical protein QT397_10740 [Microbulbifer sp. MKSA007]|nr:hypothetical protein QT397_10740 [Microbulbifer sp. MKSA007]
MKDKEIYSEIARLLYGEAPKTLSEIHALIIYVEKTSFISVWTGELRSVDGAFPLSMEAAQGITNLVNELKEYCVEQKLGVGMLYILLLFPP